MTFFEKVVDDAQIPCLQPINNRSTGCQNLLTAAYP